MAPIRVLIANDPRSYRQALALAIRQARPCLDIVLAEPADLDHAGVTLTPHLVICSRLTPRVRRAAPHWILLYPHGANLALLRIGGQRRRIVNVRFADLLAAIDEVVRLQQMP